MLTLIYVSLWTCSTYILITGYPWYIQKWWNSDCNHAVAREFQWYLDGIRCWEYIFHFGTTNCEAFPVNSFFQYIRRKLHFYFFVYSNKYFSKTSFANDTSKAIKSCDASDIFCSIEFSSSFASLFPQILMLKWIYQFIIKRADDLKAVFRLTFQRILPFKFENFIPRKN